MLNSFSMGGSPPISQRVKELDGYRLPD